MASQIFDRAHNTKSQPVWQPYRSPPSGYAPHLGAGPPGRPSSNTIRKVLNGRLYGTSVMPSDNSRGGSMARSKAWPPPTPQPGPAPTADGGNLGSAAGPSGAAYGPYTRNRRNNGGNGSRHVVRSQVAG
jgi:hypothetical protein